MQLFRRKPEADDSYEESYSSLYGDGVYVWDGTIIEDPLRPRDKDLLDDEQAATTPLLVNKVTGESFFARKFGHTANECYRLMKLILNPPPKDVILWPQDLVTLTDEQRMACDSTVVRVYSDVAFEGFRKPEFKAALLFPLDGIPQLQSCSEIIDEIDTESLQSLQLVRHNWHDATIQSMAVGVARAFDRLNESGYAFFDFHRSRIFFSLSDGHATPFLDFSSLICSLSDFGVANPGGHLRPHSPFYPLEFGDPAYLGGVSVGNAPCTLDYESQNYSLAALLFYLLMGFHPYDGSRLVGMADHDLMSHYAKFTSYAKLPVFVFDPDDTSNAFGTFDEDQEIIALWEELPETLRTLFLDALCEPHAMRRIDAHNATPKMWVRAFEELGWN